ncbi:MAG: protein kinase [Proteobacteria bacterium]|nr:protein kinase [Pseudomonadota bacterium]
MQSGDDSRRTGAESADSAVDVWSGRDTESSALPLLHTPETTRPTFAAHGTPPAKTDADAIEVDLPEIGTVLKHYEVIRVLGRGGMGKVLLARDIRLGRLVALKFITSSKGRHVKRFMAEARATANLNHDCIVNLYDIGHYNGTPYMVLGYVQGQSLREWLQQRVCDEPSAAMTSDRQSNCPVPLGLPPSRVIELMIPVVDALVCAHQAGIVHRDLNPSNIMLTEDGAVKVLDFGIAKLLTGEAAESDPESPTSDSQPDRFAFCPSIESSLTHSGALVGTLTHMAPEQWLGDNIDHRADLWAVGIVLYQLIAGRHPLAPLSIDVLQTVADLNRPMPSVSDVRSDIGKLGEITDRCLIKRKHDRIGSARELLDELQSIARIQRRSSHEGNPYAGLTAFQERDAGRFYGRTQATRQVVTRLAEQPLVTMVGPSGAGKSSFVRAGVIPALKRDGAWEALVLRPGPNPLSALAELLLQHTWPSMHTDLSSDEALIGATDIPTAEIAQGTSLAATEREQITSRLHAEPGLLGAVLRRRARQKRERILLFIDQFEEIYTLASEYERHAFLACVGGAADEASSPLRVVVAMRSDFLDRVTDAPAGMTELISRNIILLRPMDRDGLRLALVEPAAAAEYRFDSEALIDAMLDQLEHTAGALPLLQFTASRLWDLRDREGRVLTEDSYHQLGGVAGTLASHADAVLDSMTATQRQWARVILLRLVTPERTRAFATSGELSELAGHNGAEIQRVLTLLIDARLLTIQGSGADDSAVEIVHESLINTWPTLAQWLSDNADEEAFLARLRSTALEWEKSGKPEGLLWRGNAAAEAQRFYQRHQAVLHSQQAVPPRQAGRPVTVHAAPPGKNSCPPDRLHSQLLWRGTRCEPAAAQPASSTVRFSKREEHYLAAVLTLANRSRQQRWRLTVATIASLSVMAIALSYLVLRTDREAERAEKEAARAEREATRAHRQAVQARNATRMAVAREHRDDPTKVVGLLRELEPPSLPRGWANVAKTALHAELAHTVLTHPEALDDAAFSPDGRHIVVASHDGIVRVWQADGHGQTAILLGHEDRIKSAAFSRDGSRIVTASHDKTARVWPADGGGPAVVLRGHTDRVRSARFSPDGTRIVTASFDKTVRVWPADGRGQPLVLRGHSGRVQTAAFSPDGTRIVTASSDKTVRVWPADGRGQPLVLHGHDSKVESAQFSADGTRIITASSDRTVRVWPADGQGDPVVLRGHEHTVYAAAFSPDGTRIVTASGDKTVRVWPADGRGEPVIYRGHDDAVRSAHFSPDGTRIVTSSSDATVRVWRVDGRREPLVLRGHDSWIASAAFSPDGRRVVTASGDRTARVWPADGKGEPLVLHGHEHWVVSAAFSPDGSRIVTGSADKTARVWRADGTGQPLVLRGHDDRVSSAAFSPNGDRIVTASRDKTARVWRVVQTSRQTAQGDGSADYRIEHSTDGSGAALILSGHNDWLSSAAFSPDGTLIVTASADKTARVWRADGQGEPVILRGHEGAVYAASFSPDGSRIVTASTDKTARVWRADGSSPTVILRGHDNWLYTAEFSLDGTRIVTASADKSVRIWRADGQGEPLVLVGHEDRVSAAAFSPDGTRVVSTSGDKTARVWSDLKPLELDDPRLWTHTTYCMSIARRQRLLGVSKEIARANRQNCLDQVRRARAENPR